MFLTRLKKRPWVLCLAAAVCLSVGLFLFRAVENIPLPTNAANGTVYATTPAAVPTRSPTWPVTEPAYSTVPENFTAVPTGQDTLETPIPDSGVSSVSGAYRYLRYLGFFLCFLGVILGFLYVFLCRLETPVLGPELSLALLVFSFPLLGLSVRFYLIWQLTYYLVLAAVFQISLRELWWWLLSGRCSPRWSLPHRLGLAVSQGMARPERYLLFQVLWTGAAALVALLLLMTQRQLPVCACFLFAALLGIGSIWKYGRDFNHLLSQLTHLSDGQPITVQPGTFEQTEKQLTALKAQHEQAIQTAVTSERFKVELISNVSHDLRTPLTAILGYGELLERERLSTQGEEQLRQLNRKAGYMKDLVDSLFELTKVSSGALESHMEQLDLIRLLEQTLGLFDDQLRQANLQVRRHYAADSVMIVTDGARMHQVFANLLGNAIKYALPGSRVHLEVKEGEGQWTVRLTNIASYEMDFQPEEILQRFARGDKARSTQGSGLGLAIAQTYTESVGGHFQVAIDGDQFSALVTLPKTERDL